MRFTIFLSPTFIFIFFSLLCFSPVFASSTDTLNSSDSLSINQTLISAGGKFELGFFSKGKKYYLGIWFNGIPQDDVIVWVANRDSPSYSSSCTLKIANHSNLEILDDGANVRWSSNQSTAVNPVLQLLDSGNLVIREAGDTNPGNYLWQSFDNPTDTLIPGQKLGWNLKTGLNRFLTSWAGPEDPSTGKFSLKLDYHGDPQIYLLNVDRIIYRTGPWLRQRFSGVPEVQTGSSGFNFSFYTGSDEVFYTFELPPNDAVKSWLTLTFDGLLERWTWVPDTAEWTRDWYGRNDQCDYYRTCGPYGICNVSRLFVCQCPPGFQPENTQAWGLRDGSDGCRRNTKLNCENDGFLKLENMRLPETETAFVDYSINLDQCRNICKMNCSCTGYANPQVVQKSGSGCVTWIDNLTDMRDYVEGGHDLYIRLAASDLDIDDHGYYYENTANRGLILGLSIGIGLPLLLTVVYWFYRFVKRMMELRRKAKYFKRNGGLLLQQEISSKENVVEKARIFSVSELEKATDNFNKNRILGQGGQGTVYKGMMADGKIVAVKKSKKVDESQLEQFINEVVILSQVNHRNVVKLLGCCLETEVPLLVYEFIPNGTLYHHIHDPSEDFQVTWKMRLQIATESANAIAYLHSSSYPLVYHRDIKSTNILLDDKYRAKVSDFGTSKAITIDHTHVTTCVKGTYGYLDPEYFQSNQFTEKSDVYSFGVVLVELITGRKPICPTKTGGSISLASDFLFHIESSSLRDILDTRLVNEENKEEFMAVAKLARQCLKMNGRHRPTMKEVAMELEGIRSHHVKNLTQHSYAETNEVLGSRLDVSMSFPDNSVANCFSIDVEPLIANSF